MSSVTVRTEGHGEIWLLERTVKIGSVTVECPECGHTQSVDISRTVKYLNSIARPGTNVSISVGDRLRPESPA